jgi:ABC-type multidrug transport system fused ATPase/permease subunit
MDKSLKYFLSFIGLAVGTFFLNAFVFAIWKMLSERIAYQFRVKYVEAFTRRSIGWIEKQNLYETSSKFKNDCLTIEKATGDKVALFYNLIGIAFSGMTIAICIRWTFALFLIGLIPVGMIALGYFIYILIVRKSDSKEFF